MDADLDPNAFLQSVRELKEKRQKEDKERNEQLEAQIMQDRELRQARNLERERSLSPEKTTPQSSRFSTREATPVNASPVSTTTPLSSTSYSPSRSTTMAAREGRESPAPADRATSPSKAAPGLARSGTMSWQKRPGSISVRSRPLSAVASENSAARSPQRAPDSGAEDHAEVAMSKDKIAQSLATKDPAWFRQTADRGLQSPAYRSGKGETTQETASTARRQLPGMAREVSAESVSTTRMSPPPESSQPSSPSRAIGSVRASAVLSSRPASMASISEQPKADNISPLAKVDAARFASPTRGRSSTADGEPPVIGRTMSNAQTRIATDRPVSPTKGMGGFVQSAFMKRTDSVNKRWSAQQGTSLARQESTASIPSRFSSVRDSNMSASRSMPRLDQTQPGGEPQSRPGSAHRPGSSHSIVSNLALGSDPDSNETFAKPSLPSHSHARSKSVASLASGPDGLASPPLSPSKRWSRSPTKSSWLESALSRPESPKPALQTNQPSWMAEISKVKQQRNGGEQSPSQDALSSSRPESPKPSLHSSKPSWMAEISKAKEQRNSGERTLSQDTLDAARAQAAPKTSEEPLGLNIQKKPSLADPKIRSPPARSFTPPTKAKPAALAGRPTSQELKSEMKDDKDEAASAEAVSKENKSSERPGVATKPHVAEIAKSPSPTSPFNPRTADLASDAKPAPLSLSKPASLASPKSKPDTPPKKDFRSGLKSRSDLGSTRAKEEPEFKAVFGKLKKAQTEKYVAPDELKDNILRGKAGLSLSDGPQKRERKDELRDSLIKKKEEIKIKRESDPPTPKISPAPPSALPEALKIRQQLSRSGSTLNVAAPEKQRRDVTPEALSLHKTLKSKQRVAPPEKASAPESPVVETKQEVKVPASVETSAVPPKKEEVPASIGTSAVKSKQEVNAPASVETSAVKPKQEMPASVSSSVVRTNPVSDQPAGKPAIASSKFADRFNPALAGLLARGPPSSNPASPRPSSTASTGTAGISRTPASSDEPSSGTQLTHMTKNRAKGPKRRKPNAKATTPKAASPVMKPAEIVSPAPIPKPKETLPSPSQAASPAPSPQPKPFAAKATVPRSPSGDSSKKAASEGLDSLAAPSRGSFGALNKPMVKTASPSLPTSLKPVLPLDTARKLPASGNQQTLEPLRNSASRSPSIHTPERSETPVISEPLVPEDANKENQSGSVKNAASMWGKQAQRVASRGSPIQLPTRKDEEAAMKAAGLLSTSPSSYNASPTTGLGISDTSLGALPKKSPSGERSPSGGPPRPSKSSRVVSASLSTKDLPSLPDARVSKNSQCLIDYFGSVPFSEHELRLDTQSILTSRPGEVGKIKTLRKSIQEITGDGKLTPLPTQEEHILYEQSMYVCTHVFGSAEGARVTEVYLWAGVGVSESAIQDAQIFAKRIAKEAGAGQRSTQLLIIDQNREPAAFFQALGGIVIVRRGARAKGNNPYMLCGRPHMGHVAFDEVELSKASLCSDFPYIVARPVTLQETKIYLWKGSACGPEAIGSARLIGMDLNPSGEIIEVEEGQEPQDLLLLMSDLRIDVCKSPELWKKTRNRWDHSTARLFRITAAPAKLGAGLFSTLMARRPSWTATKSPSPERPSSITSMGQEIEVTIKEISPFTQTDLEPEGCFVMDCGPTILVLPGPLLAKQQHFQHAFAQALLFAHDYIILSASLEDRPAIPTASVVLSGLPREAELRFRRFDKARGVWGTEGMMAGRRMDGLEQTHMLDIREALELCCKQ